MDHDVFVFGKNSVNSVEKQNTKESLLRVYSVEIQDGDKNESVRALALWSKFSKNVCFEYIVKD